MFKRIVEFFLGKRERLGLEHRCYNGVCLIASFGCLLASVINPLIGIPFPITLTTFFIGTSYLWLFYDCRRNKRFKPNLVLYTINGVSLIIATWFFNGGINGPVIFISMVALVAMTVVMRSGRVWILVGIFMPAMGIMFLLEFWHPDLIVAYESREQRFLDIFLTFLVSTGVIFIIITLILQSYHREKKRLDKVNLLLKDKMAALNQTNEELAKAFNEIRTLSGLLPICSSCKKIRDDKGYWNQIETYIQNHSDAEFSHSLCPDCTEEFYGQEKWFDEMLKKLGR